MNIALYRRYRPKNFLQIIGQEHITVPLMNALRNNKISHAYLFSGPKGCGKTTSARVLAKSLNCFKGPIDIPCEKCDSCIDLSTIGSGSLDVVEIDAASHGGVDDARELRENANFSPTRDRYKIFIIDEAHMVTSAGFNALLKIVEEPPKHIKFIFATTQPNKVIETIRSRTHNYSFHLVPPAVLKDHIHNICSQENVLIEEEVVEMIINAGNGSVRDCISILDQLIRGIDNRNIIKYEEAVKLLGFTSITLISQVIDDIASGDVSSIFKKINEVIQSGNDPIRFIEDLLKYIRDLIVLKISSNNLDTIFSHIPKNKLLSMKKQSSYFQIKQLVRWADQIIFTLKDIVADIPARIYLELLFTKIVLSESNTLDNTRIKSNDKNYLIDPPNAADKKNIHNLWDDIMNNLKTIKRSSWILVNQNALIKNVDNNNIYLSFSTEGLSRAFNEKNHKENLKKAIKNILNIELNIYVQAQPNDNDSYENNLHTDKSNNEKNHNITSNAISDKTAFMLKKLGATVIKEIHKE